MRKRFLGYDTNITGKGGTPDFIKMKSVLEKTTQQESKNAITEFRKMLHSVCLAILDLQRTFRQKSQKSYHQLKQWLKDLKTITIKIFKRPKSK